MIEYLISNYKDNIVAMSFAYIGIISIVAMFLPKNNLLGKIASETKSIFTTLFKK
jgi:hypothetical protein